MKFVFIVVFLFCNAFVISAQALNLFYFDLHEARGREEMKAIVDSIIDQNSERESIFFVSNSLQSLSFRGVKDTGNLWNSIRDIKPNTPDLGYNLRELLILIDKFGYRSDIQQYYFISQSSLYLNSQYLKQLPDRLNIVLFNNLKNVNGSLASLILIPSYEMSLSSGVKEDLIFNYPYYSFLFL